ncbi:Fatty acid desaturase [Nitrosomonas cryotolerans]|uniref:Fatty acid desaturase n=1 Tax=Nitrosomonas cryotolerans ATCC 49181 TaxID=1131553 RepID=A0A1N6FL90_9PROT|nr:fatty acid desaturase [Nitrosomonas cryotolerans]SFP82395.1 Fatty acid desaturase [Nitrosomonas cryotolerans]SIN96021.1 Fatty acid desaturase [Nitrosomonas cryotolerans ATCC 49181]
MTDTSPDTATFPLHEAHELVRDLMTPNPWIYWIDFLFHISLGWSTFIIALSTPLFSFWQLSAYLISVFALYRSAIFVHELAHLKKGTFRIFRLTWNLVCGIPLMIPSFTYDGVHHDHHKPGVYGTSRDGEYIPFATKKPIEIVGYALLSFILPLLLVTRFLLLTPLSYLIPSLRKIVWERASSLTIDPSYRRAKNTIRNDHNWRQQEWATCLFALSILTCIAWEILPHTILLLWYAVAVAIFLLNSLRTLAAHAYRNSDGRTMTFTEQYLDSINIPGNLFITALWAPVGLRYHATHHLFMSMPYHNLGKAQRRLIHGLSDNTLYLKTVRNGLWDALIRIWRESSISTR